MDKIAEQVLRNVDEKGLIQFTRDLVKIRSLIGEEKKIAEFYAKTIEKHGLEATLQEVKPNRPNAIGRLRGSGGGRSLMFNGHIDHTPAPGVGWTHEPYGAEVADGYIYGVAVSNMKAANASYLFAADAIRKTGIKLKGDIILSYVVGETPPDVGIGILHQMDKGIKADMFVVGESTDMNILTMHTAVLEVMIRIKGVSTHFGTIRIFKGVNAIEQMMKLMQRLGKSHEVIKKGDWLTHKGDYEGFPRFNLGAIRGGLGPDYIIAAPHMPDNCMAVIDFRFAPDVTKESLMKDLQKVFDDLKAQDPDFNATAEYYGNARGVAFEVPVDEPIVQMLARSYRTVMNKEPKIGPIAPYIFMGSDASKIQKMGGMRSGVIFGAGEGCCVPNERVKIDDIVAQTKIFALTALEACG